MSDMQGIKALALEAFAKEQAVSFIRFDYFGHGESSGEFKDGTIGHWKEDVLNVIDQLTCGNLILVGSSMGGWLMLLAARERQERIKGLVGIAAAPDFTQNRIWEILDEKHRALIKTQGWLPIPCDDPDAGEPYPVTFRLIEEGKDHLLLQNKIDIHCPVRLLQGGMDTDVPRDTPLKLLDLIQSDDMTFELVKNSNHRFSSESDIKLIKRKILELM